MKGIANRKGTDGKIFADRDNRERSGTRKIDRRVGESTVTRYKQAERQREVAEMAQSEKYNIEKEEVVDHSETKTICRGVKCR